MTEPIAQAEGDVIVQKIRQAGAGHLGEGETVAQVITLVVVVQDTQAALNIRRQPRAQIKMIAQDRQHETGLNRGVALSAELDRLGPSIPQDATPLSLIGVARHRRQEGLGRNLKRPCGQDPWLTLKQGVADMEVDRHAVDIPFTDRVARAQADIPRACGRPLGLGGTHSQHEHSDQTADYAYRLVHYPSPESGR